MIKVHSFKIGKRTITLVLLLSIVKKDDKIIGQKIRIGRSIKCPNDRQNKDRAILIATGRAKKKKTSIMNLFINKTSLSEEYIKSDLLKGLEREHRAFPFKWFKEHIAEEVPNSIKLRLSLNR